MQKKMEKIYLRLEQRPPIGEFWNSWVTDFLSLYNEGAHQLAPLAKKIAKMKPPESEQDLLVFKVFLERCLDANVDQLIEKEDGKPYGSIRPFHFILDNFRSAHNVGSVFRTAETFGAKSVICSGYTATPDNPKVKKTAMGAEKWVKWSQNDELLPIIQNFQQAKYTVIALETVMGAPHLHQTALPEKSVFLLGNETHGLPTKILKKCNLILRIPMQGRKNSLNVSVVAGICAHTYLEQWHDRTTSI